jgi:Zinc carboxypeptidase
MLTRCIVAFLLPVLLVSLLFAQTDRQRTLLIRIDNVKPEALLKSGILTFDEYDSRSIVSMVRDTAFALVTPAERSVLRERGFPCVQVMEDSSELALIRRAVYGPTLHLEKPYHSYTEIIREVLSLQSAFPSLVQRLQIGTTTGKQQPIYAVKVSHDVRKNDARPAILINGCHHSNEILGAEICVAALHELAEQYGRDPEITRWVDMFQIYIVPVVNVDGHDIVTSGTDPRWRKNTRDTDSNGVLNYPDGVDINRNYDFNWAHGGSGEPSSGRYRGAFPFSESEPRALAALAQQKRFILSLTYHSQGEVVYYPWVWGGRKAPDDLLLTDIAQGLAGSITTMRGDLSYKAEYGAGLVGQSYPWLYGRLGTFDFVVETGKGASVFPPREVEGIVRANLEGIHYMLHRAEGPGLAVHIADARTSAPLEAAVWFPAIETEDVARRTSNPETGVLHRLLKPGPYALIISRPGYVPTVLNDVKVGESGWTKIVVRLEKVDR